MGSYWLLGFVMFFICPQGQRFQAPYLTPGSPLSTGFFTKFN